MQESAESFEITSYGEKNQDAERQAIITQIFLDYKRESPSSAIHVRFEGTHLKIFFISYEMFLPQKVKAVDEIAEKSIKEAVKHLKKEYKARAHSVLDLKEDKDLATRTVQKVSMNERYMYIASKAFEIV